MEVAKQCSTIFVSYQGYLPEHKTGSRNSLLAKAKEAYLALLPLLPQKAYTSTIRLKKDTKKHLLAKNLPLTTRQAQWQKDLKITFREMIEWVYNFNYRLAITSFL